MAALVGGVAAVASPGVGLDNATPKGGPTPPARGERSEKVQSRPCLVSCLLLSLVGFQDPLAASAEELSSSVQTLCWFVRKNSGKLRTCCVVLVVVLKVQAGRPRPQGWYVNFIVKGWAKVEGRGSAEWLC